MSDWNRNDDVRRSRGEGPSESRSRSFGFDEPGNQRNGRESGRDHPTREARGYSDGPDAQRSRGGNGSSWRDMDSEDDRSDRDAGAQRSQSRSGTSMGPASWTYTEMWVIPGPFLGRGPRGYKRSDDRIKEDACERLAQHGQIDATNIEVSVEDCEITLRGTVDSRETKRRAEDAVESIAGVRDVKNELRVAPERSERDQPGPDGAAHANTRDRKQEAGKSEPGGRPTRTAS